MFQLLRPASMCAKGTKHFSAASEAAGILLVSPNATTIAGEYFLISFSNSTIILDVCSE